MGIHGDKSQQERDWVLNGELKHYLLFSGKMKFKLRLNSWVLMCPSHFRV